ncbi:MAG TPA: NUDIX pyrophosphatase [Actinomycetota bacterium]
MTQAPPTGSRGRAPFQVHVIPYRRPGEGGIEYALFRRVAGRFWQGIAGGGEDDETPLEAALREVQEEAGFAGEPSDLLPLDSMATIPVVGIMGGFYWGPDVLVVPEFSFGLRCTTERCVLSEEHDAYRWFAFGDASRHLRWDSNRNALWELDHRLRTRRLPGAGPASQGPRH